MILIFLNRTFYKKNLAGICLALTLPLWTSCNNDLFVDEFLAEDVNLTVACGDSAMVHFDADNWDVLSIDFLSGANFKVKSYDSDGNLLSDKSQYNYHGMARIEAENDYNYFEIERTSERKLKFRPLEMMHDDSYNLDILVGNEYEQRQLKFTIQPSPKYQVDSIAYNWDSFDTFDNEIKPVGSILLSNQGSTPMTYYAHPYKNGVKRTFEFFWNHDTYVRFIFDEEERVTVPDVENGKPVMKQTQIPLGENGKKIDLPLDSFNPDFEVPVIIDPYDERNVTIWHQIENYKISCTLYTSHPISHRKGIYQGRLYSARPYGYLIFKETTNQDK